MQEAFERVKSEITIEEVLGRYGYPTPSSKRIACPVHAGTHPNFSFTSKVFNCFVCGIGGSVIDLVAALEKISPAEAVERLSSDFGVKVTRPNVIVARHTKSQVERFKELQKQSPEIELPNCKSLEEGYRGLRKSTIEHWGLARTEHGVLIPLLNGKGKLCSYSIRRDDGNPKYDNAPGTSKCFPYGLFENAADIIKEGFAWIVEGQLDAVSLWQKGHRNVVALMGSSLSERQAMLILAVTSNLMLCLDGDEAGRVAAAKIKKQWQNVFDIGIFELPPNVDPDEFEGVLER